jgi:hypothetical protein
MTHRQMADLGQGAVLLAIGMSLLLILYYLADFVLSHILVILPIALAVVATAVWRWGIVRR